MNKYPLLIEIGCEDLPPADVSYIEKNAAGVLSKILEEERIGFRKTSLFTTPRRIGFLLDSVNSHQDSMEEKVKGPPCRIAINNGEPTKAGLGFASRMGVDFSELIQEETPKGKYLFCVLRHRGKPVRKKLEGIVGKLISSLEFPVRMRWPGCKYSFPRPIRWITVKMGKSSVRFKMGSLKSSRSTIGHYLFADRKIALSDVYEYEKKLRHNYVIADSEKRKKALENSIERTLKYSESSAEMLPDLLEEINNSLEFPTGVKGSFPEKYLSLPQEVIEACLVHHQKYFPVKDKQGRLLNSFIGVRDGISQDLDSIRRGYEKVLIARLEDAEFFLKKDRKSSLRKKVDKLKGIEFTRDLGTLYDKTVRVKKLAGFLSDISGKKESFRKTAEEIAFLGKVDLTTLIVGEFPELEGVAGRIYSRMDGESKKISEGIFEHYKPKTREDTLPSFDEAAVVGACDRVDTLTGNIGRGVEATGSQDPFGIRRTCRGLLRIIRSSGWDLDTRIIFNRSAELFKEQKMELDSDNLKKLDEFLVNEILRYAQENFQYDVVRCAAAPGFYNITRFFKRAESVRGVKDSKGFDSLITAFKRSANILDQASDKGVKVFSECDAGKLVSEAEKNLFDRTESASVKVEESLKKNDYTGVFNILADLRGPIDRFFDEVLVMDPKEELMKNRLALLKGITELFSPAGDVSKLEIKGD